jgi:hypothetical protein
MPLRNTLSPTKASTKIRAMLNEDYPIGGPKGGMSTLFFWIAGCLSIFFGQRGSVGELRWSNQISAGRPGCACPSGPLWSRWREEAVRSPRVPLYEDVV